MSSPTSGCGHQVSEEEQETRVRRGEGEGEEG